jgi:hypothetical protein
MNKSISLLAVSLLSCLVVEAHAQNLAAASRQVLSLPRDVVTVAVWPVDMNSGNLPQMTADALSDQIEQQVSRKALELKLKVVSRRQLASVLKELKLSSADLQSFDAIAKSKGIDAIVVPSVSMVKSTCMNITLKALGTSEANKAEVLSSAKPFKVGIDKEDLDFDGCN